jgi:excinuclease ABC subunit B
VETLDRSDILDDLRRGVYDAVIGVNLLREGLDLPEVTLVAILDADQEGFLRSRSSLIQTMGRAARHVEGVAILYADKITRSMREAIDEIDRRRAIQVAHNKKHGITPLSINKSIREQLINRPDDDEEALPGVFSHRDQRFSGKNTTVDPKRGQTKIELNKRQAVILEDLQSDSLTPEDANRVIKQLTRVMNQSAKDWDFELAAKIRDTIERLER